ncbi:hypothetical protein [Pseudonocardia sp. GCM10023141]|uniref:DUF3024 domain-containing protein n=1 Tax=Pseudonocardia sp. GCM10023141 TaxID=3252653 RepID=UPI0036068E0B
MAVPEETRQRLSRWCAARVPDGERERRQIGFAIQGDEVTILDRRPPTYPELDMAWSATPVVQLRREDATSGRWVLYRRSGDGRSWRPTEAAGEDPITLLDSIRAD